MFFPITDAIGPLEYTTNQLEQFPKHRGLSTSIHIMYCRLHTLLVGPKTKFMAYKLAACITLKRPINFATINQR